MSREQQPQEQDYPKIPEWFNLERYEICKKWGLAEWYFAFKLRRNFMHTEAIQSYLKDDDAFIQYAIRMQTLRLISMDLGQIANVASRFNEVCGNEPIIKDRELSGNELDKCLSSVFGEKEKRHLTNLEMVLEASTAKYKSVSININASRDMILKAVTNWHKDNYQETIATRYAEKDFKQWRDRRILPYIDLYIYSRFVSGKNLSYLDLWDLLYPTGRDYVERYIDRTIRSNALELTSDKELNAMEAQLKCEEL